MIRVPVAKSGLGRASVAAALTLAVAAELAVVSPSQAHCPNQLPPSNIGVAGSQTISSGGVRAVRATIEWTNPNPCTIPVATLASSLEMVNLSRDGINNGFVQVGWVDREG